MKCSHYFLFLMEFKGQKRGKKTNLVTSVACISNVRPQLV